MSPRLAEQLALLPEYGAHHLRLCVLALLLGAAVSLPLAVALTRRPRLRFPVLAAVGVLQTVPGLAMLALMVPVLALLSEALKPHGVELSALGFLPALIALTLYGTLPVLRNTVIGVLGVEPALTDAARGLGMSERQVLWKVELPLAAPVIVAGLRTASVWVVGTATLATPVGQACLGNYIFGGLQTRNWVAVGVGCVAAAALALLLDGGIALLERAAARRDLGALRGGLVLAAVFSALSLAGPTLLAGPAPEAQVIRIGSKAFTEQYILAAAMEGALVDAGFAVERRDGLGSTVLFDALVSDEIDVAVDYSGTLWTSVMQRSEVAPGPQVLAELSAWLQETHGALLLGPLGFENAYALAMRRDRAAALGLTRVDQLTPLAPQLRLGSDYEFFQRPEWATLRETYDLNFGELVALDAAFMYEAVDKEEVELITAYTSDGRVAAYGLVVLEDPAQALPPYDAALLLSPSAAGDPGLRAALLPFVDGVPVSLMQQANEHVDVKGGSVSEAAALLRAGLPPGAAER